MSRLWSCLLLVAVCLGLCHSVGHAQSWSAFAQVSPTMGNNQGRLCVGDTNSDLGCPSYAPSLTTAGHVSVTGNLSAARFIGDGSGLTNLSAANVSVTTGASGSLVYRDAYGSLVASTSLSISSSTGSVGIGAGAPGWMTNGLYASGVVYGAGGMAIGTAMSYGFGTSSVKLTGDSNVGTNYLAFTTSNTEAMRIVSSGYVGFGTTSPSYTLHVSGTLGAKSLLVGGSSNANGNGSLALYNGSNTLFTYFGAGSSYINAFTSIQLGIGTNSPSSTLHVSGTLRIADGGEACDTHRLGAIKYQANAFYICQNTSNGWEALSTSGANSLDDRITSSSQAGVIANSTGYISLTTGGVTGTVYFDPSGRLVNAGVSTTGPISGTTGYFSANGPAIVVGDGSNNASYMTFSGRSQMGYDSYNNDAFIAGVITKGVNFGVNGGTSPTMRITSMSLVGINTTAPSVTLHVSGTGYFDSVGIGTTTPGARIHVYGNLGGTAGLRIQNTDTVDGRATVLFTTSFGGGQNYEVGIGTGGGSKDWKVRDTTSAGSPTRLTLTTSGSLGIGTTSPEALLTVSGTLKIAAGTEACDASRLGAIKYTSNAFYVCQNTSNGWEALGTTGANSLADRITSSSQAGVTANSTGYISLTTGGVTGTVYFAPNGVLVNAGVSTTGTISTTQLRVYSSGTAMAYFRNPGSAVDLTIDSTATSGNFNIRAMGGSGDNLILGTSGTDAITITSATGYVGIGTASPTAALHVNGYIHSDVGYRIRRASDGASVPSLLSYSAGGGNNELHIYGENANTKNVSFKNSGGTEMAALWTLSGNPYLTVGIFPSNTTIPSATLHVSGTARFDSNTEIRGTVSATLLKLADSPSDPCDASNFGAIKVVNGAIYTCRQ